MFTETTYVATYGVPDEKEQMPKVTRLSYPTVKSIKSAASPVCFNQPVSCPIVYHLKARTIHSSTTYAPPLETQSAATADRFQATNEYVLLPATSPGPLALYSHVQASTFSSSCIPPS